MSLPDLAAALPGAGLCDDPVIRYLPICAASHAASSIAGGLVAGWLGDIAHAVVAMAGEVLGAVLEFLAAPVQPDLGASWFGAGYTRMLEVSGLFATLFFLLGLLSAVVHRSPGGLARTVGYTVGAFAFSGVALWFTQAAIVLVDVATGQIAAGLPTDIAQTFTGLMNPLVTLAGAGGGQALLAVLLGLFTAFGALAVYLELFVRNVMIHIVVYFLPLMLIGTIWGPTRRWARRAIEFLAVLIFAKFVLYAVIALGWSAVASFGDDRLSTSWASVLTGLVLIGVAAYLPYLLFKLLPFMEAHVGQAMSRRDAGAVAKAPLAPVTSSIRTVQQNLRRASAVAAVAGTGGTAAPAVAASIAAGGGRPQLPAGTSTAGLGAVGRPDNATQTVPRPPSPPDRTDGTDRGSSR